MYNQNSNLSDHFMPYVDDYGDYSMPSMNAQQASPYYNTAYNGASYLAPGVGGALGGLAGGAMGGPWGALAGAGIGGGMGGAAGSYMRGENPWKGGAIGAGTSMMPVAGGMAGGPWGSIAGSGLGGAASGYFNATEHPYRDAIMNALLGMGSAGLGQYLSQGGGQGVSNNFDPFDISNDFSVPYYLKPNMMPDTSGTNYASSMPLDFRFNSLFE